MELAKGSGRRAILLAMLGACAACAARATPEAGSPATIPTTAPLSVPVSPLPLAASAGLATREGGRGGAATTTTATADDDATSADDGTTEVLPAAWAKIEIPRLAFVEAMRAARKAHDGFDQLKPPAPSPRIDDPALRAWYGRANALCDRASRMYAAAFHADDAPGVGRLEAIADAATLAMGMARTLDRLGIGEMPAGWKSDPALGSTFEEVAVGPTRRWRDEARVLVRQCTLASATLATDGGAGAGAGSTPDAVRRCTALRTGAPLPAAKGARAGDAGTCACAPGDPLCSASLGGWCGPGH